MIKLARKNYDVIIGEYLSTLAIAKFAKSKIYEIIKGSYIDDGPVKILVIAANPHLKRALRDVQKCIPEAEVEAADMSSYPFFMWFDKKSEQWWTRRSLTGFIYEFILRNMPWKLYKKICLPSHL